MKVIASTKAIQAVSKKLKTAGKKIGFVPTMGYLHEGHLSLVRAAKKECDIVVVSIFVNPTQFGQKEDLKKYPRGLKRDKKLLARERADILFHPSVKGMYPSGFETTVEAPLLGKLLCGKTRPHHFKGVTTVVLKLFEIIKPDVAYFGAKDFQQQVIIKKMVKDLNLDVLVKALPIIREKDGLAMSSRNAYLQMDERQMANCLYRSLSLAKSMVKDGAKSSKTIISAMKRLIKKERKVSIDYIGAYDPETLEPKKITSGRTLFAIAAYIGKTRLIDNIVVKSR